MKKIIRLIIKLISFLLGVITAVFFGYRIIRNYRRNKRAQQEIIKVEEENSKAIEGVISTKDIAYKIPKQKNESKTFKGLSSRQKRVYEIIRQSKKVEMRHLLTQITGVTERTLRRDLLKLQELGLVLKKGSTKSVTYLLKENE